MKYYVPQQIMCSTAMMWESETLWQLLTCCVILYNIIVEDEGDVVAQTYDFEAHEEQVKSRKIKMRLS